MASNAYPAATLEIVYGQLNTADKSNLTIALLAMARDVMGSSIRLNQFDAVVANQIGIGCEAARQTENKTCQDGQLAKSTSHHGDGPLLSSLRLA